MSHTLASIMAVSHGVVCNRCSSLGVGIKSVFLCAYGMKIPLGEVEDLSSIQQPSNPPPSKFDIGVNVDLPLIPLFKISRRYEGTIYPMLLSECGSAFIKLNVVESHDIRVELKCYPRVVHTIKVSEVTMNMPCTNQGMKKKMESIKGYILQILDDAMPVTGFQIEMCFKGHLSFRDAVQLFRSYSLTNAVPEGIEIDQG